MDYQLDDKLKLRQIYISKMQNYNSNEMCIKDFYKSLKFMPKEISENIDEIIYKYKSDKNI
jgi:hypothetical protein